jgi:hypothetical protein
MSIPLRLLLLTLIAWLSQCLLAANLEEHPLYHVRQAMAISSGMLNMFIPAYGTFMSGKTVLAGPTNNSLCIENALPVKNPTWNLLRRTHGSVFLVDSKEYMGYYDHEQSCYAAVPGWDRQEFDPRLTVSSTGPLSSCLPYSTSERCDAINPLLTDYGVLHPTLRASLTAFSNSTAHEIEFLRMTADIEILLKKHREILSNSSYPYRDAALSQIMQRELVILDAAVNQSVLLYSSLSDVWLPPLEELDNLRGLLQMAQILSSEVGDSFISELLTTRNTLAGILNQIITALRKGSGSSVDDIRLVRQHFTFSLATLQQLSVSFVRMLSAMTVASSEDAFDALCTATDVFMHLYGAAFFTAAQSLVTDGMLSEYGAVVLDCGRTTGSNRSPSCLADEIGLSASQMRLDLRLQSLLGGSYAALQLAKNAISNVSSTMCLPQSFSEYVAVILFLDGNNSILPDAYHVLESSARWSVSSVASCRTQFAHLQSLAFHVATINCSVSAVDYSCHVDGVSGGVLKSFSKQVDVGPIGWTFRDIASTPSMVASVQAHSASQLHVRGVPGEGVEGSECSLDYGSYDPFYLCGCGLYCSDDVCTPAGVGFYSLSDSNQRLACENVRPVHSHWVDSLACSPECTWECDTGYTKSGEFCDDTPLGFYMNNGVVTVCPVPLDQPYPYWIWSTARTGDRPCLREQRYMGVLIVDVSTLNDVSHLCGNTSISIQASIDVSSPFRKYTLMGIINRWELSIIKTARNVGYFEYRYTSHGGQTTLISVFVDISDTFVVSVSWQNNVVFLHVNGHLVSPPSIIDHCISDPLAETVWYVGGILPPFGSPFVGRISAVWMHSGPMAMQYSAFDGRRMHQWLSACSNNGFCPQWYEMENRDSDEIGTFVLLPCGRMLFRRDDLRCDAAELSFVSLAVNVVTLSSPQWGLSERNFQERSSGQLGLRKVVFYNTIGNRAFPSSCTVSAPLQNGVSCSSIYSGDDLRDDWQLSVPDFYLWISFAFQTDVEVARVVVFNSLNTSIAVKGLVLMSHAAAQTDVRHLVDLSPVYDASVASGNFLSESLTLYPESLRQTVIIGSACPSSFSVASLSTRIRSQQTCSCVFPLFAYRGSCRPKPSIQFDLDRFAVDYEEPIGISVLNMIPDVFLDPPSIHYRLGNASNVLYTEPFTIGSVGIFNVSVVFQQRSLHPVSLLRTFQSYGRSLLTMYSMPGTYIDELVLSYTCTGIPSSSELPSLFYRVNDSSSMSNFSLYGGMPFAALDGPLSLVLAVVCQGPFYRPSASFSGIYHIVPRVKPLSWSSLVNTFVDVCNTSFSTATVGAIFSYSVNNGPWTLLPSSRVLLDCGSSSTDLSFILRVRGEKAGFVASSVFTRSVNVICRPTSPFFFLKSGTYPVGTPLVIAMNYSNSGQDTALLVAAEIDGTLSQVFEYKNAMVFYCPVHVNVTVWNRRVTSASVLDSLVSFGAFIFREVSPTPVAVPDGGDSIGCSTVTLSGNGSLFFSLNFEKSFSQYVNPFRVCFNSSIAPSITSVVLSFFAVDNNKLASQIESRTFRLFPQCSAPIFNVSSGDFYRSVSVDGYCSEHNAILLFTDGNSNGPSVWNYGGMFFNRTVSIKAVCTKDGWYQSGDAFLNLSIIASRSPPPPSVIVSGGMVHTNSLFRLFCSLPSCVTRYDVLQNGIVMIAAVVYNVPFTLPAGNVTLRAFSTADDYDGVSSVLERSYSVVQWISAQDFVVYPANGTQFWPAVNVSIFSEFSFSAVIGVIESVDYGETRVDFQSWMMLNSSSTVSFRVNTSGFYPSQVELSFYMFFLNETLRPAHCEMPASNDSRGLFSLYGALSFSVFDPRCSVWLSLDNVVFVLQSMFTFKCSSSADYDTTLYVKARSEDLDWSDVLFQRFSVVCPPESVLVTPGDRISPSAITMTATTISADPFTSIQYSMNAPGSATVNVIQYAGPVVFTIFADYNVSVFAVKRRYGFVLSSSPAVRTYGVRPTAAPVIFSRRGGSYDGDLSLSLTTSQGSAGIRFWIDSGIDMMIYSELIMLKFNASLAPVPTNVTVLAKNYMDGHFPSAGTVHLFTLFPKADSPVVSAVGGTFYRNATVTLSCPRTETRAFYTIDGSVPKLSSFLASTNTIHIHATVQLVRVSCLAFGWVSSDIVSVGPFFIVQYRVPSRPVISQGFLNHSLPNNSVFVSISCAEVGCRTYYTIDGTTPTLASDLYSFPVILSAIGPVVVRAMVYVHGYDSLSAVASETFIVYKEIAVDDVVFSHLSGYHFWPSFHLTMTSRTAVELYYRVIVEGVSSSELMYSSPVLIDANSTVVVVGRHPYFTPSPYSFPTLSFVLDETLRPATASVPIANTTASSFIDIIVVNFSPAWVQVQVAADDGRWTNLTDNTFVKSCAETQFLDVTFNESFRAILVGLLPSPVLSFMFQLICTPSPPEILVTNGIFEPPIIVGILPTAHVVGTLLHYTMDDSEPSLQSPMYTEPINISGMGTVSICAIAVRQLPTGDVLSSEVSRRKVTLLERSLMPLVYPMSGRFVHGVTVTIGGPSVSAPVWCSVNGNTADELYRQPLMFTYDRSIVPSVTSIVLTCVTREDNKLPSPNVTRLYSIIPQSSLPVVLQQTGFFYKGLVVVPVCNAEESAVPLCTVDGSDPMYASVPVNSTGISLTATTVLQCRCYSVGWELSDALVRHYTVISSRFPDVVAFSHQSMQFLAPFNLSLSCATANSRIFYTADRSAVTPFIDVEYFTPIRVSCQNVTVCALCWAADHDGTSSTVCHSYRYVFPISMTDVLLSYPDGHRFWPSLNVTMINPKSLNVQYRLVLDNGTILTNWTLWTSNVIVSSSCTVELLLSAPYSAPTVVYVSVHYVFDPSLREPHADAPSFGSTQVVAVGNFSIPITTSTSDGLVEVCDDTTDAFHPLYSNVYRRACTSFDDIFFTLKVRAYTLLLARSDEVSVDVTLICPPPSPVIYPPSTDVGELLVVTIFPTPTLTVLHRYTLDGTDVTPLSPAYSGFTPLVFPYVAGSSVIVKARSYKSTMGQLVASEEVRSVYSFFPRASPPIVTPLVAGSFVGSVTVSMATAEPVDFVSFRVNGGNWTIYDHPLVLHFDPLLAPGSTLFNVYCKATRSLHSDSVVVISSFIVLPQLDPPTVLPESGLYPASVNYSVNCPVGATARYANDPSKAVSQWLSIDPGTLRTLTPEHSGRWIAICQKSGWVDSDQTVRDLIIVSSKFTTAPHIVFSSASVDAGVYIGPLSVTLLCFDPRCEIMTTLTMSTTTRTFTATNNTVVFIEQYGPVAITAIANASDSAPSTKVSVSFLMKKFLDASIVMLTPSKNETFVGTLLVTIDQRDMSGPGIEASYQLNYLNGSSSSLSVPLGSVVGIQESLDLWVTVSGMYYYPQYHSLGPFRYMAIVSNGTRLDDSGSGQGNVSSSSVQTPSTSSSSDDAATTSGVTAGLVALFSMVAVSISGFVAMKWWRKRKNVRRRENIDKMHLLSSAT